MIFSHKAHVSGVLVLFALLLSACGPVKDPTPTQAAVPVDAEAISLMNSGRYELAATAFTELALKMKMPKANDYYLYAAEAQQEAGLTEPSRNSIQRVDINLATPEQFSWMAVLQARAIDDNPTRIQSLLNRLQARQLPMRLRDDLFRLKAQASDQQGDALGSARHRSELDQYLTDPQQIQLNHEAIWSDLNRLPESVLSQSVSSQPQGLGAWIELLLLTRHPEGNLTSALNSWSAHYPDHPGNQTIVQQMLEYGSLFNSDAQQIALLLPESGRFAAAAAAIRDGFMAAWLSTSAQTRPNVVSYNANSSNISGVYEQAVTDGAELIVGPLEKQAIDTLLQRESLPVPTLALNRTADSTANLPAQLIQFGLSPEGEAEQVAEKAWSDGHQRALLIIPANAWGERVEEAFRKRWQLLGGEILKRVDYPVDTKDFSPMVARMLNADSSNKRRQRLQARLGEKVHFERRRRQDAEFVFMGAFSNQARQIRPQLRFFKATKLPVYATSHIYNGKNNPVTDIDMDGIIFGDMPWLVDSQQRDNNLYRQISVAWPENSIKLARLYALGIDAFRVVPKLAQLRLQPNRRYPGQSGQLGLNNHGQIERQLTWSRFDKGSPSLLSQEITP